MNGARAEDSVKIIKRDIKNKKMKIGPNHHFLEVLRKYQSSANMLNREGMARPA